MEDMRLLNADCLEALRCEPADSLDSLVTDPPAGISFMGKNWDTNKGGRDQWIAWLTEIMKECLRVLKPGAHGLVWALPRTSHWTATALENAGFEVRDVVTHLFGSGFPKNHDISKAIDKAAGAERPRVPGGQGSANTILGARKPGEAISGEAISGEAKQWQGWGTVLKPSSESWFWITKPSLTKEVALDYQLLECHTALGAILCQTSPAKFAALISASSSLDGNGEFDSAQWLVSAAEKVKLHEVSELMAMFDSQEAASIFLSIVSSWNAILSVSFDQTNTFITSTKTSLTTELKILKSFLSGIIHANIIPENPSGIGQNAHSAASNLSAATVPQSMSHSVHANVIASIGPAILNIFASIAGILSGRLNVKDASIVRMPVTQNQAPEEVTDKNYSGIAVNAEKLSSIRHIEIPNIVAAPAWLKRICSEHYILVRKPCSEKTVAANVLKHGTGGINIDASRIGTETRHNGPASTKEVQTMGRPGQSGSGWNEGYSGNTVTGRFPSNLVLDEEAAAALDEQTGNLGKSAGGNSRSVSNKVYGKYSDQADGKPCGFGDRGGASRFFYTAKASKADRGAHNTHPTVKSTVLMTYLLRLVTPEGGTVLDPFMGSGSTGVAAKGLGMAFVGIEQSPEYHAIAVRRVQGDAPAPSEGPVGDP